MVSKASEDLPEPDSPVNTTSLSRGMSRSMFLRLCSRAPRMEIMRASRFSRPADLSALSNRSFMGMGTLFSAEHSENDAALPVRARRYPPRKSATAVRNSEQRRWSTRALRLGAADLYKWRTFWDARSGVLFGVMAAG